MKKLKNGSYKATILFEEGDFRLSNGSDFSGVFLVECFEKNFGTFEEDTKKVFNIDPERLKMNSIQEDFFNLKSELKEEILDLVKSVFVQKLEKFQ